MNVRDFDFALPNELIAQEPLVRRDAARLLVLARDTGAITHTRVEALPDLLAPGDLLVVNDTRVFPARLLGHRVPSGGAVECLLVAPVNPPATAEGAEGGLAPVPEVPHEGEECWEALMHAGQKLRPGARVVFDGEPSIHAEVLARRFYGRRIVRLWTSDGSPLEAAVERAGHVPLPPYIRRADRALDRDQYQTMFARSRGSVAAPTAGLHFTDALVEAVRGRGVELASITLHVGYGTFQPVRVDRVEEHRPESERFVISPDVAEAVNRALDERRRVIAVGTTTTRALETVAAAHEGRLVAGAGTTNLFIYPGFEFKVIRGLMTNFHLPRSSLLMLVSAFAGRERLLAAYEKAIEARYRFYSYGDAMLIV